jgi:hypothetical protein
VCTAGVLLAQVLATLETAEATASGGTQRLEQHEERTGLSRDMIAQRYAESVNALRNLYGEGEGGSADGGGKETGGKDNEGSGGWKRAFEIAGIVTSTREVMSPAKSGGGLAKSVWFKSEHVARDANAGRPCRL